MGRSEGASAIYLLSVQKAGHQQRRPEGRAGKCGGEPGGAGGEYGVSGGRCHGQRV